MTHHSIYRLALAASLVLLCACGGGGGGGNNASTPTSVTTTNTGNKASFGFVSAVAADGSTASSLIMMTGTFDIAVVPQSGLTCKIDTDGDGVFEYIRPNCTSFQQAHQYRLGSAVGITPKMQIIDSNGVVITQYGWYARLDEDTILPNASRTTWDKAGVTYITPSGCDFAVGGAVNAATIQTAIDSAAASSQVAAGGTCYATIPAGTHTITSTINLKSGVILRGTQATGQTTAQTILSANINGAVISAAGSSTADIAYTGQDLSAYKNRNHITVPVAQAAAIGTLLAAQTKGYLYANFASEAEYLRPIGASPWHLAQTMNARLPFPDLFSTPIDYVNAYPDSCNGSINNNRSSYWCVRDYADYTVGQWVKIISVQGTKVVIDGMINDSYPENEGLQYRLNVFGPAKLIENAGIEDLAITRTDSYDVNTVQFDKTTNTYIRRTDIQLNYRAAVAIDNSMNCEASKNYIHAARIRGGNGQGYGVAVQSMSTGCLVTNNIMTGQRHAMSLQFGANGNVVSENYAIDGQDTTFSVAPNQNNVRKADLSVHGHYAHMNLLEGNYVGSLMISDWHGRSPFHAVYRNHVTNGIRHNFASFGTAFIDNVIDAGYSGFCAFGVCGFTPWTSMTVDLTMAFAPIGVKQVICFRNVNASGVAVTAYDTTNGSGTTNLCNNTIAPVVTPPNSYYRPTLGTPISTSTNAARDRAVSGKFIW